MNEDPKSRLTPARPDDGLAQGKPAYMPRLPWRLAILGVVIVGSIVAFYRMREGDRAADLKARILAVHTERLGDLAERYESFRGRLEGWILEAGAVDAPETYVDPRLNISGLRSGDGIYLRIPAAYADDGERIEAAALAMEPDAIGRCLGLAPMSGRGLWQQGGFLRPEWREQVENEGDVMHLRVREDELTRHVRADVPVISSMMGADWFMLVLQRGENRRDHPVDVYLWDLREGQLLLRARIRGRGLLVPVRLGFEGAPQGTSPRPSVSSGAAQDCSIASQLRGLVGDSGPEFRSGDRVIEEAERLAAEEEEATLEGEASADDAAEDQGAHEVDEEALEDEQP